MILVGRGILGGVLGRCVLIVSCAFHEVAELPGILLEILTLLIDRIIFRLILLLQELLKSDVCLFLLFFCMVAPFPYRGVFQILGSIMPQHSIQGWFERLLGHFCELLRALLRNIDLKGDATILFCVAFIFSGFLDLQFLCRILPRRLVDSLGHRVLMIENKYFP